MRRPKRLSNSPFLGIRRPGSLGSGRMRYVFRISVKLPYDALSLQPETSCVIDARAGLAGKNPVPQPAQVRSPLLIVRLPAPGPECMKVGIVPAQQNFSRFQKHWIQSVPASPAAPLRLSCLFAFRIVGLVKLKGPRGKYGGNAPRPMRFRPWVRPRSPTTQPVPVRDCVSQGGPRGLHR